MRYILRLLSEGPALRGLPVFPAPQPEITAIDILLEPDATKLRQAEATTPGCSRFTRKVSPWMRRTACTSLSIQLFVRTEDLDKVYAAAELGPFGDDKRSGRLQINTKPYCHVTPF